MPELISTVVTAIITVIGEIISPIIYEIYKKRQHSPVNNVSKEIVVRLYHAILERDPDPVGLIDYGLQLQRKEKSPRMIVREICKSEEYFDKFIYSVSPQQAVESMYLHLLCRKPESEEIIKEHIEILNKRGHQYIIDKLVDSQEYSTRFGEYSIPGS